MAGLLCLVLTLACWSSIAVSAEIKECRVGFAGVYKVGHWTPIGSNVAGPISTQATTIEVTATTATACRRRSSAPVPAS